MSEQPEAVLENILRLMGLPAPVRREDREGETRRLLESLGSTRIELVED